MVQWNKEIESLVSKLGEYVDIQMKILLDTRIGVTKSASKIVFNFAAKGTPLMNETCKKLGINFKGNWKQTLKTIIKVAEENDSLAAEKIKKAIPLVDKLENIFKGSSKTLFAKIKLAKKQKFNFD